MSRWSERPDVPRGDTYDQRWRDLEAAGVEVHGEADLVDAFDPATVLDAGCGTGRVAIELARRGKDVVGVDLDPRMLASAVEKAPHLDWIEADLADVRVETAQGTMRTFDVVVAAGNVMIFVEPGTEGAVVTNLAHHLAPNGHLIAGFQLKAGRLDLNAYDLHCADAGLRLQGRWSTWDRDPFVDGGDYAVSVHKLDAAPP